jgi:hypothetical protein
MMQTGPLRTPHRGPSPAVLVAFLLSALAFAAGREIAFAQEATRFASGESVDPRTLAPDLLPFQEMVRLEQGRTEPPPPPLVLPSDPASPPLALDPYLHLLAARDRQAAGDKLGAELELEAARKLDPDLLEAHLFASRLGSPGGTASAFHHLGKASQLLRARFALQSTAVSAIAWGLTTFMVVWLTLLATAYASHAIEPVQHLVSERLRRAGASGLSTPIAGVLMALPLLWGAGLLITALVLIVLSGPRRSRGEKAVITAGLVLIAAIGIVPRMAPAVFRPPSFQDRAQVLDVAAHAPLTPGLAARLTAIASEGVDLALLVHAQALERHGEQAMAESLIERYARLHPDDARGHLVLGNLRLRAGDGRNAVGFYRRSIALDSTHAAPFVNLALAYSSIMQFGLANDALAAAGRIDRDAPVAISNVSGTAIGAEAEPLPAVLAPAEIWELYRAECATPGIGVPVPAYLSLFLPWNGGAPWPLALLLVGMAAAVQRLVHRRLSPFPCSVCRRSVCRRCVTRRRGLALCGSCQKVIGDVPAAQVVRQFVAGEKRRMKGRMQVRRAIINTMCPGQGLLLAGRPLSAALILAALALVAVSLITHNHPVVPLPTVPAGGPGPLPGPAGALIFIMAWIGAAAIGAAAKAHIGPELRGHIVPLAAGPAILRGDRQGRRTGTHG